MAVRTPHQNVAFESSGTQAHGYLALPESGKGPGVIVIQEWWGLTDHIRDVADRLAARGFVALAPDLFGGSITHDSEEAGRMMSELPEEKGAELLAGAGQAKGGGQADEFLQEGALAGLRRGAGGGGGGTF